MDDKRSREFARAMKMKTVLVIVLTYVFYRALMQWRLYQKSFRGQLRDMKEGNERFALVLGHALLPTMEKVMRDLEPTVRQ